MALVPLNLIFGHDGHSSRQRVTCRYRCGDACAHPAPNTSDNEYFGDIARRAMSRRSLFKALGVTVLAAGSGSALAACSAGKPGPTGSAGTAVATTPAGMNFAAVAPNIEDAVVIPAGYRQSVVISWGDPVLPGAPAFDVGRQSAAAQREQFGFNNDFAALLPIDGVPNRFLLVVNHEYTTERFMYPGYDEDNPTREQFETSVAAHGISVVEVERTPDGLKPLTGRYNRRLTAESPFLLTGPAAGSQLVRTAADPAGVVVAGSLNNCGGGLTPWGTVLSAEENFNVYFGSAQGAQAPTPADADRWKRYGIKLQPSARRWETFQDRFDLTAAPNEVNRFGYVLELNPWDPDSAPVKHTALGRFKHEGANIHVTADGTVVTYSGDDERFDYMYKFVSSKKVRPGRDAEAMAANMTILDEGTLYGPSCPAISQPTRSTDQAGCPIPACSAAPEPGSRCCDPARTPPPSP